MVGQNLWNPDNKNDQQSINVLCYFIVIVIFTFVRSCCRVFDAQGFMLEVLHQHP